MKHSTYIQIVKAIASESKCVSMKVGAIIVREGRIIAHGYNGTASGEVNCCDKFPDPTYEGGKLTPELREEHHQWSNDNEIHAEANALIWAGRMGISPVGADMWITISPCNGCLKLIKAAGIRRVFYLSEYDKGDSNWINSLKSRNIEVYKIDDAI